MLIVDPRQIISIKHIPDKKSQPQQTKHPDNYRESKDKSGFRNRRLLKGGCNRTRNGEKETPEKDGYHDKNADHYRSDEDDNASYNSPNIHLPYTRPFLFHNYYKTARLAPIMVISHILFIVFVTTVPTR